MPLTVIDICQAIHHNLERSLYHVPKKVSHPVDQRTDTTDKLQVFGLGDPLLD